MAYIISQFHINKQSSIFFFSRKRRGEILLNFLSYQLKFKNNS